MKLPSHWSVALYCTLSNQSFHQYNKKEKPPNPQTLHLPQSSPPLPLPTLRRTSPCLHFRRRRPLLPPTMASTPVPESADGPVLNLINKRLRALRKKHNRIIQMEESVAQGKPLNKEQEEVLRSKPSVIASIDELEKLRQPLSVAVSEEIEIAVKKIKNPAQAEKNGEAENEKEEEKSEAKPGDVVESMVGDLLNLLYFGALFDVRSQNDFTATMLSRTHERGCCLTYDTVTDEATDLLSEKDLDLISSLSGLVVSRPVNTSLSHKHALQRCVEHAKLWLDNSDKALDNNANVSYAGLREKLNKIMASDYFTTTPEIKASVDVAAAAAVQVPVQVESQAVEYQQQVHEDATNLQGQEFSDDQSNPAEEQHQKDEPEMENPEEKDASQYEETKPSPQLDDSQRDEDPSEQQQYANRRNYQHQRGGGRGSSGGGRRGGGYPNGRGGRGSGRVGGNGRGQYYDQPVNYYPRTYYNNRGRAGGRGGGSSGYQGSAGASDTGVAS
ncbi:hypothetical protein LINPERHAP1_LOCUS40688 [Linum perenne]